MFTAVSVGRDVSSFFPTVVINIACPSFEVKNLVYIYLVRCALHARKQHPLRAHPPLSYAEFRPDEALLSVNSFQKDLAHPNPRVRALALRVLSSIRVHVIVPVVVLAIRACSRDPSPYVRKAAAHAVPKIFRLDRGREEELVEVVEALLRDAAPMVLSSAVAAFTEVCPHRLDLLHRHYRKLCCLLVDTDEWGQALLANLLLRYARTQFTQADGVRREGLCGEGEEGGGDAGGVPSQPGTPASATHAAAAAAAAFEAALPARAPRKEAEQALQALLRSGAGFYEEEQAAALEAAPAPAAAQAALPADHAGDDVAAEPAAEPARPLGQLDEDHRLLLRCSRPLLQSRNAAVVLAVATLQWYLAPAAELARVAKALVFALRSSPEASHVLLQNIASMAALQPALFAPYLPAFFSAPRDSAAVRALKLEVLTRCAQPQAADRLLCELQLCLRDASKHAVVLAVRAVGRTAARLPHIAPACVRSLLDLSSHPAQEVASEAVVVLRALIQQRPEQHGAVVLRLMRRLETLRAPAARAAVVWLAAWDGGSGSGSEEAGKLAALAPHALRLVARSFGEEEELVKLALLGSCAKLRLRSAEAAPLYGYVLELAAVDVSYDVRDRARLLRALLAPTTGPDCNAALAGHAAAILLCDMPAPPLPSPAPLRSVHMLNSLSHSVKHTAPGFVALPPHPLVAPPSSVRAAPPAPVRAAAPGGAGTAAQGGRRAPAGGPAAAGDFYSSSGGSGSSSYTDSDSFSDSDASLSGEEDEDEEPQPAAGAAQDDPSEWGAVPKHVALAGSLEATSLGAEGAEEERQ